MRYSRAAKGLPEYGGRSSQSALLQQYSEPRCADVGEATGVWPAAGRCIDSAAGDCARPWTAAGETMARRSYASAKEACFVHLIFTRIDSAC